MKRLLPLLALTACDLDDFAFGGAKDPCEVSWVMSFEGMEGLDLIRPGVSRVSEFEDGVAWTATWAFAGEESVVRFRIAGPRLDVIESDGASELNRIAASNCEVDESESVLRREPLAYHVCSVLFEGEGDWPGGPGRETAYLVLEEVDTCPPG